MKTCPNCGAQIDDNSLFCTECGKQIPQGNVCSHCGASVNSGDSFCQNCGKSLKEIPNSESISYEGESKSGFKKYLPYILGGVILLGIIGYCSSNKFSTGKADVTVSDSMAIDSSSFVADLQIIEDEAQKALEKILSKTIRAEDTTNCLTDYLKPYYTNEYKNKYDQACEKADREGGEYPKLWWSYSDSDPEKFAIDEIEIISANEVKAKVRLTSEMYIGDFEVITKKEDGEWRIDKVDELNVVNNPDFIIEYEEEKNTDWLQGHWVYEQGSYKGHFIIQGNKITQYSSMNPERYEATFRIEDGEIKARLVDGMDLAVPIDYVNQRIDYGDGCWMHKVSSSSSDYSSPSSNTSSSKTFANEQYVTMYLANQTFRSNDGLAIRVDGNLRMYIDGDYAGVVSVLRFNSTSALLRYGGGAYGDGRITVQIVGDKLQLIDPEDGSVYHQR